MCQPILALQRRTSSPRSARTHPLQGHSRSPARRAACCTQLHPRDLSSSADRGQQSATDRVGYLDSVDAQLYSRSHAMLRVLSITSPHCRHRRSTRWPPSSPGVRTAWELSPLLLPARCWDTNWIAVFFPASIVALPCSGDHEASDWFEDKTPNGPDNVSPDQLECSETSRSEDHQRQVTVQVYHWSGVVARARGGHLS
jgi:hypothetical protein